MGVINDKYCIVKGVAGLGNRLATIASAVDYCKKTGRILCVDWSDGMFGEKGKDIFRKYFYLTDVQTIDIDSLGNHSLLDIRPKDYDILGVGSIYDYYEFYVKNKYFAKGINWLSHYHYSFVISFIHRLPCGSIWRSKQGKSDDWIEQGGSLSYNVKEKVVVYLDYIPCFREKVIRSNIKLRNETREKIDKWMEDNGLKEPTIGVHVRATDKKYDGNLEVLFKKIDIITKKRKIKHIFLASDNHEIEKKVRLRYKEKVIVYPKFIPAIEKGGIHHWGQQNADIKLKEQMFEESICDMYILSKVEWLLYQGNSSFSNISRIMKNDNKCLDWTKK